MAKNFLATFGLFCMVLLLIAAVGSMGALYDWAGLVKLPNGVRNGIAVLADEMKRTPEPTFLVNQSPVKEAQWTNPLEALAVARDTNTPVIPTDVPTETLEPTETPTDTPEPTRTPEPTATPTPTETPIPPLEPGIYQSQTMSRLKDFADALQGWMKANNELAKDNGLLKDKKWREGMQVSLEDIANTSRALAEIGPAPQEYAKIDEWFDRIQVEAGDLAANYKKAIETGDEGQFVAASREFTQIKEDLSQVVQEMQAAGWDLK